MAGSLRFCYLARMELMDLQIESIAPGGDGVARCDGKVYFVAGAAPGDRLLARVTRDGGRWAKAEIESLLEGGPGRVEPPCPLAGRCGGCQLQHLGDAAEREAKLGILTDSLARIGGLASWPEIRFEGSPTLGYRRRARFQGRNLADGVQLGFLAGSSHEMVPHDRCLILEEPLQAWASEFKAHLSGRLAELFDFQAEFTLLEDGALQLLLRVEERVGAKLLRALQDWEHGGRVHLTLRASDRRHSFQEDAGPHPLETLRLEPEGRAPIQLRQWIRPGDFIQANRFANRAMLDKLLGHLELDERPWLLDLYAGTGNLTLPLALAGARVLGVEENSGAVRSARRAARENRVSRARFRAGDAGEVLPLLAGEGRRYRTVVLDPPRGGAPELAPWLDPMDVREIASLSCDPATLARDLKSWTEKGFRLEALHLFDFFPQTHHVESLAILRR